MTLTRRALLSAAAAAAAGTMVPMTATPAAAAPIRDDAVLTTDFRVNPSGDPDDAYDLLCARALGIRKVVLDAPRADYIAAVESLGMYAVPPEAITNASVVAVVGAATHAAAHYRWGQRVILFAGDYTGVPEANQDADPAAYDYVKAQHNTYWVPCFQGGLWAAGPHASYVQTTDQALTSGIPRARAWLQPKFPDRWGQRNLWAGALLNLAFMNSWGANGFDADRAFLASPDLVSDMVGGTRWLLAQY